MTFAANQGEIGGGEVMLLAMGDAARGLGHDVCVVGPDHPSGLVDTARERGFEVVAIPSASARTYLKNLRRWDARHRKGLLWCNGLRPALATAGRPRRVVHLHQVPQSRAQAWAAHLARRGTSATVVPSHFTAAAVKGATVLWNWTDDPGTSARTRRGLSSGSPAVIGYLGRLSVDKGVPQLCEAISALHERGHAVRLLLAGEARFVSERDHQSVEEAIAAVPCPVDRAGWVSRDEFFPSVDVAVFPSVWGEAFGLVAAEAMAARCPFVVTDAGGLPEVVGDDYPLMSRRGDVAGLADTLERALTQRTEAVVDAAHARWATHFSPNAGRQRFADLLKSITHDGTSS